MPRPVAEVGELRREELRALATAPWWRTAMVLVPVAIGILAAATLAELNPLAAFVIGAVAAVVAGAVGTYLLADCRARSAFIGLWASARGWTRGAGPWVDEATPLLREGDRRESMNHVFGPLLADGTEAVLCHYTYEIKHTSSSNGHTSTRSESHDFTVVEAPVSAPELPFLSLHPRAFGDNRLFDRIDSAVTSDRVVELESSELERRYKLEVDDSVSDLAVRLVFDPKFIVWCLDQPDSSFLFELERDTLVVATEDHSYDPTELDDLVEKAGTIAARLADAGVVPQQA